MKSFNSSPVVPTPSLGDYSNNVVTSKWVKDINVAPIYVSPTGSDNNDGMTSDKAVRTITKALEVAEGLGQPAARLVVEGGTYDGDIFCENKFIHIQINENTTINGNVNVVRSGCLRFYSDDLYPTLTVNGHVTVTSLSYLVSDKLNINLNDSTSSAGFSVSGMSYCYIDGNLSITKTTSISIALSNLSEFFVTGQTTIQHSDNSYNAVNMARNAFLRFQGSTSISGSVKRAFEISVNSTCYVEDLSITYGTVKLNAIALYSGSCFYFNNGTSTIYGSSTYNYTTFELVTNCVLKIMTGATVSVYCCYSATTTKDLYLYANSSLECVGILNFYIDSNVTSSGYSIYADSGACTYFEAASTLNFGPGKRSATVCATRNAVIYFENGATISAETGTYTGRRFVVDQGSIIYTRGKGANAFPGSTDGTITSASYGYYG